MARFKAVLFDFDGTLVDSVSDLRVALNRVLGRKGRRPVSDDEVRLMVGDGAAKLVERGFAATGEPWPEEDIPILTDVFIDFYDGKGAAMTKAYPGVMDVLKKLKDEGIKLGVCTNKPQGPTDSILRELGMASFFDAVIGGDALAVRKPHAGHVEAVLDKLGVSKAEAAFVGDSPNDVAAGHNAGLPVVAVSYGYSRIPPKELGAEALIDDFDALPNALKRID